MAAAAAAAPTRFLAVPEDRVAAAVTMTWQPEISESEDPERQVREVPEVPVTPTVRWVLPAVAAEPVRLVWRERRPAPAMAEPGFRVRFRDHRSSMAAAAAAVRMGRELITTPVPAVPAAAPPPVSSKRISAVRERPVRAMPAAIEPGRISVLAAVAPGRPVRRLCRARSAEPEAPGFRRRFPEP